MKIGVRVEELYQPKAFTSKRIGVSLEEIETSETEAENKIRSTFDRAKQLLAEQKVDSNEKTKE